MPYFKQTLHEHINIRNSVKLGKLYSIMTGKSGQEIPCKTEHLKGLGQIHYTILLLKEKVHSKMATLKTLII
jgi:hypothetical protein